jgi:IS30 family transposase
VNEFNGKYEIDLVKGTKTTVNQLLYVIDSNKRIIGKVKIKEINSDKAIASFQESFMDITPGMDSGIRNQ